MSKKEISKIINQTLVLCLMVTFVISAVYPDYLGEHQTVNIEEADLDGNESSEEKKEHKEDKENFKYDVRHAVEPPFRLEQVLKHSELSSLHQELYLPVITPPPDRRS